MPRSFGITFSANSLVEYMHLSAGHVPDVP